MLHKNNNQNCVNYKINKNVNVYAISQFLSWSLGLSLTVQKVSGSIPRFHLSICSGSFSPLGFPLQIV